MSFTTTAVKLVDVRPTTAALVLGLAASLAACADPGSTPAGTPAAESRTVTLSAGAVPARPKAVLPSRLATRPGPPCATRPVAVPKRPATTPRPLRSAGAANPQQPGESGAAERARRALEAANTPFPRRGPLRDEEAAESCARALRMELTLLTAGRGEAPEEAMLRRTLSTQGLSGISIGADSAFAASTGKDCVFGTFTTNGPELTLGPPAPNGTCEP